MAINYSRRSLFKMLGSRIENSSDPLFEKYRRKNYSGRKSAASIDARVRPLSSGLAPYSGPFLVGEASHLLRRIQFGAKKADIDTLVPLGMNGAVNLLLTVPSTIPSPPINNYEPSRPNTGLTPLAYGADWTQNVLDNSLDSRGVNIARMSSLQQWNISLAVNQELNIIEKATLFWFHFIPTDVVDLRTLGSTLIVHSARVSYHYIALLRENCLGNFKSLIRKISLSPAMMFYLNNNINSKTAPDENFAREIMELFTLGKGSNSKYTQEDVVQAAKVLTGWRVQGLNTATVTSTFNINLHDTSNKQFSAFFDNKVINSNGAAELDEFIDMIFSKSEVVSEYICRRLYRFFVYYDIDDAIEANVIKPLAKVFVDNNWEILPVLNVLFKSQHFYDIANRGVYIKTPFDVVIGTIRNFNATTAVTDSTNYAAQYAVWGSLDGLSKPMEQESLRVPNVSGWVPFYQSPSFHEYWINSNTVQKRYAFTESIFKGILKNYNGLGTRIEIDAIGWIKKFPNTICADPDLLVNECIKYLLPIDLSVSVKNTLKTQHLLSNQIENYYWTNAWNAYIANPSTANTNIVKPRITNLLKSISQLAEYQLM